MPNHRKFTQQQRDKVASKYPTCRDVTALSSELGMNRKQVHLLAARMGIKRTIWLQGYWELQQGDRIWEQPFKYLSGATKIGKAAKRDVKKHIDPRKPYTLTLFIKSSSNMKLTDAKQEVANIIAGLDQNQRSSTGAYSDLVKLLEAVANEEGTYEPRFRHTKSDSQCLQKAADDEPIFVLRGQDAFAPATVLHWMALNANNALVSDVKMAEAFDTVMAMRNYVPRKYPS